MQGGSGGGKAGDWKSNPGGAGLLGGESSHFLIIDNRRHFLTSWRQTLADWLVFALALSCSQLYLCRGVKTQGRRARRVRAPSAESGFEPKTPPLCLPILGIDSSHLIFTCGMIELRTWNTALLAFVSQRLPSG